METARRFGIAKSTFTHVILNGARHERSKEFPEVSTTDLKSCLSCLSMYDFFFATSRLCVRQKQQELLKVLFVFYPQT